MKHYSAKAFRARDSIGYLLKRSHSLLLDQAEAAFAQHDLTFTQWVVLLRLRDGLGHTATDLCRDFSHDSGALTRLLDQLEARGLIGRSRSRTDRRVVELSLTRAGRDILQSLIPLVVDNLNWSLAEFGAAEFRELRRLLEKLIARLESRLSGAGAATRPARKRK